MRYDANGQVHFQSLSGDMWDLSLKDSEKWYIYDLTVRKLILV
jgi:hypothetical protein